MKRLIVFAQLALFAVITAACGNMTSPTGPTTFSSSTPTFGAAGASGGTSRSAVLAEGWSAEEVAFASSISSSNEALLRMATIEHRNGDLAAVQAFAFQILQDLTAAQSQLQEKGGGLLPAPSLGAADDRRVKQLEGLIGQALDRAFLENVMQVLTADAQMLNSRGVPPGPSTLANDVQDSKGRAERYYFMARDLASLVGAAVSDPGTSGNGSGGIDGSGSGAIFFNGD